MRNNESHPEGISSGRSEVNTIMLDEIQQIFDECERAKMDAFENGIRANDLAGWSDEVSRLELIAYNKIKSILRREAL